MLPARARLTRRADFSTVVRRGRRTARPTLVVHALLIDPGGSVDVDGARVGFVVSRAVGGSVLRHRVTRRLRHVVAARLGDLPSGARIVVRALPPAAVAGYGTLAADLATALPAALRKAAR